MPRFFCDYCDVYLTHDSFSGRKQHMKGRRHQDNVRQYYLQYMRRDILHSLKGTQSGTVSILMPGMGNTEATFYNHNHALQQRTIALKAMAVAKAASQLMGRGVGGRPRNPGVRRIPSPTMTTNTNMNINASTAAALAILNKRASIPVPSMPMPMPSMPMSMPIPMPTMPMPKPMSIPRPRLRQIPIPNLRGSIAAAALGARTGLGRSPTTSRTMPLRPSMPMPMPMPMPLPARLHSNSNSNNNSNTQNTSPAGAGAPPPNVNIMRARPPTGIPVSVPPTNQNALITNNTSHLNNNMNNHGHGYHASRTNAIGSAARTRHNPI